MSSLNCLVCTESECAMFTTSIRLQLQWQLLSRISRSHQTFRVLSGFLDCGSLTGSWQIMMNQVKWDLGSCWSTYTHAQKTLNLWSRWSWKDSWLCQMIEGNFALPRLYTLRKIRDLLTSNAEKRCTPKGILWGCPEIQWQSVCRWSSVWVGKGRLDKNSSRPWSSFICHSVSLGASLQFFFLPLKHSEI